MGAVNNQKINNMSRVARASKKFINRKEKHSMKHIILIILLTIGVWAQEIGVPYVDQEKIGNESMVNKLYADKFNQRILYRANDGYVVKDLTSNMEIWKAQFKSDIFECVANPNLSQVVCKSGYVYRDGIESVDLYKIGQKNSVNILRSKYSVKQMIFSQDSKKLYIYTDANPKERKDNRPISTLIIYDINKKVASTVSLLGIGKIYVTDLYVLHRDAFHDLTNNPIHTLLKSSNGEVVRTFQLNDKTIQDLSSDGKTYFASGRDGNFYEVDLITGLEKKIFDLECRLCIVKSLDEKLFLLHNYESDFNTFVLSEKNGQSVLTNLPLNYKSDFQFEHLQYLNNYQYLVYANKLWNIKKGKVELSIHIDNSGNWLIITPDGYFDGSPEFRKYLYMKTASYESIPIDDTTYQKYHSPKVIKNILKQVFAITKKPNGENQ